ncbi:histidine kinase [Amycolatopsis roodepoortensis]|uniref:sensor histidine kinase n=1 Tax=Amycolatopsis roodepoortensis TaxID=700274 RepID=UPI00214B7748|nr:histidine kinase [Amycolatopsis roodepoortensis]UUV30716.1 histidine kinase [Amycolatopsis roodepoortensis]
MKRTDRRWGTVLAEALLAGFVAGVTIFLADLLPAWGWPEVFSPTGPVTAAVIVGAVVLTLARRRFTVSALLAATVSFGLFPATGVALAVVAHTAGTRGRKWPLFGVAALSPAAVVLITQPAFRWQYVLVVIVVSTVFCLVLPALAGAMQAQQARLVVALRDRARLEERSRLAEEMHDQLGHRLSLITMFSGALEVAAEGKDPELRHAAGHVRSTAKLALEELRESLGILRPGGEPADPAEATDAAGTKADIAGLVASSRDAGLDVELDWSGTDLDGVRPPVRRAVHRVVREALTNVHKHAAAASVTVVVDHGPELVKVVVRNTAERVEAERLPGTGRGLTGLRERVRLLGGVFAAGPDPEGGFAVTTELPLRAGAPLVDEVAEERPGRFQSGLLLVTGLAAVAALLLTTLAFVPPLAPADSEDPLASVRIGMTPEEVEEWFGPNEPSAQVAAQGHEPPIPEGSYCVYTAAADPPDAETAAIFRFCFGDDRLVEKTWFEVPVPKEER